jgi:cell wall-associated NlpC family hydrolase
MGERIAEPAGHRIGLRWAVRATTVAVAVLAGLGAVPGVASARPQNPSDGQLTAAQQAASDAAAQVGALDAQLATAQAQVDDAAAAANIALDTYQGEQADYEAAQAASTAADAAAAQAQAELDTARAAVAGFARDSYMAGSTSSRLTGLLTSGSPEQMIERSALLDAAGASRSTVLDTVTVAQQHAADAVTAARAALTQADTLQRQAAAALASAERVEAGARAQAAAFATQQAALQAQLQQAQQTLTALQGQRAASVQYDQQQQQQAAAAAAAAQAAARPSSSAARQSGPPAGAANSSAVETAISAATRWVGTRYAWGGGSLTGPSLGFGIDAGVVGFDCSGLTRYAYAQAGITIARNSTAQYATLPHVSRADLQRGDLVFYATDTSNPATIHHVAIYLGGGQMLEAPESGERVRITAVRWGGFIGGARPSA